MIIREGIEVTKVSMDGYDLPIPEGLSEFLLRAGYWRYGEGEEESSNDVEILVNYDRETVLKDGILSKTFTYKGDQKKRCKKS
ncbi:MULTISPECIES: hypothetical protein [Bacillus]|uniref:Uncharacterized protein n=1 Tax=Bacillus wiedmannii TaxID=1890302 RepID=J9ATB1_9BACI|nr:hypothetical protein [Bacillus wiedmannii]HDX9613673.1 hypothetical protein [Bacillus toyonensis]EJV65385.1 hypothetical protein IEO_01895 [Bacillus wiedmannii]OFD10644.1 hypothetical protein BTGOE6_17780 [Bacillus wiedmannii]PHD63721.1 hypothetical protein COF57_01205 [Bacillus wiedmannii]HDR7962500.1 hypothetical protein [Bacillus wiedmannii]